MFSLVAPVTSCILLFRNNTLFKKLHDTTCVPAFKRMSNQDFTLVSFISPLSFFIESSLSLTTSPV
jgi:hypothetical protein